MNSLGKRIRKLRERLELSQDEMARSLGIDRTAVSNIERDKRSLKPDELVTLAKRLQISVDQLLGVEPLVRGQKARVNVTPSAQNGKKFKEVLLYILHEAGVRPHVGERVLRQFLSSMHKSV